MTPWLVLAHVVANVVWIGSAAAAGFVLAAKHGDAKTRGALGRTVYLRLAVPAFAVALVTGVVRLALDPSYYFVGTKFMHGKLTFVVIAIGLHHAVGARARRMAAGEKADAGPALPVALALIGAAAAAAFFAVIEPF